MGVPGHTVDSAAIVCSYILASGFLRVRTHTVEHISDLNLDLGIFSGGYVGLTCIFKTRVYCQGLGTFY
jgi:hypothetical protein